MNRSDTTPLLLWIGAALLIGTVTYLLLNNGFKKADFEIDTYGEDSEDYL